MAQLLSTIDAFFLKMMIGFVIFLLGLIIGKFAGMIITKLLYELQIDQILETIGIKFFFSSFFGKAVSVIIYIAGIILALNQLSLTKLVTGFLIAFFSLILLAAVLLGITDALQNFVLGVYLRNKFLGKKQIKTKLASGKILEVGYTKIKILTKDKDILIVPFSAFAES